MPTVTCSITPRVKEASLSSLSYALISASDSPAKVGTAVPEIMRYKQTDKNLKNINLVYVLSIDCMLQPRKQ